MMQDMDILSAMIKSTALVETKEETGTLLVRLCEPGVPNSTVIIKDLPSDALVVKIDAFDSPNSVFNGDHGECKRADYAIISEKCRCVICIEMKCTKDKWYNIVNQLKGTQCFITYCQEVGRLFWSDNDSIFLKNYALRFISIRHTSSRKNETRSNRKKTQYNIPNTPDKATKIAKSTNLQFSSIAWLGAK